MDNKSKKEELLQLLFPHKMKPVEVTNSQVNSMLSLSNILENLIKAFPLGCFCPPDPNIETIEQLQSTLDDLLLWISSAPISASLKLQLQEAINNVKEQLETDPFSCCDTLQSLETLLRILTTIVNTIGLLNLSQKVNLLGLLQELQTILTQSLFCLSCEEEPPSFAYVANIMSDNVSVIDIASNTVIATVPVGVNPSSVAITPNGNFAYVT
ncbi:hypothetical protein V7107_28690, partial [Bacillus toyonensis]